MKIAVLAFSLICTLPACAAEPEATIGKRDCKVIAFKPKPYESVEWKGPCKDGYADGVGTLDWFVVDERTFRYEGNLTRGIQDGKGVQLDEDLSRYDGQWKNGERDGQGVQTYSDGSRYEGQWKAGWRHGMGKATYIGGKVVEGKFFKDRPAGQPAPATAGQKASYEVPYDPYTYGHVYTGSNLTLDLPPRKTWSELSTDEQRVVRDDYGMLDDQDEPPYPLRGIGILYNDLSEAYSSSQGRGRLRLRVLVDSNGKPSSVEVFASPSEKLTLKASNFVMHTRFKPALCNGTPCAMPFFIHLNYGLN